MLTGLAKKKVFVFDWDGTLFDSMTAKTDSFAAVMHHWLARQGIPLPEAEVARLYRLYSGQPRRIIFQQIARDAGTQASAEACKAMSQALFARNRTGLEHAPLFDDALPCLDALLENARTLCVSSSVPQAELSYFVHRKLPARIRSNLAAMLGSQPDLAKGVGHLCAIRNATGASDDELVVVGDDLADRELSRQAGIEAILVDREGHLPTDTAHISSLNEITRLL